MKDLHLYQPSIVVILLSLCLVATFVLKAYQAFKGPLAHVPGPFVSRWTHLRLKLAVVRGYRVQYVHELHKRYGPIVRIAPHEVSLADISAAKAVYKVGGSYTKTVWYDNFTGNVKERGLFTETDFHKHAHLRRLLASSFSEKWVAQMEPFIVKNVRLAIVRMAEDMGAQRHCDVFKWFTYMATDVIGEASFGESFRTLEMGKKNAYVHDLEMVASRGMMRAELTWFVNLMKRNPFGIGKDIGLAIARTQQYAQKSIDRYWKQVRADPDNVKPTLLTKEYAAVEDGTLPLAQLQRDAVTSIIAGTDTTAVTATYAVWLLSHHPELEEAVIREVSELPVDFIDEDLRLIKLLGYVINETLRLYGAISQGLPRLVPLGGVELCGHYLPKGEVVGVQSYTMHRDASIWKNAGTFDPYRWEEPTKDMQHSFYPFGGGSRACIGMHFAQLELRHALANFYRTFEGGVKPAWVEGFFEEDMMPLGFFLSPPRGSRCLMERRK